MPWCTRPAIMRPVGSLASPGRTVWTVSVDQRPERCLCPGDTLENPVTAERIVFAQTARETNGESVAVDWFWTRADHRTPPHVHPEMEERWEVVSGRVGFRIGGVEHTAGPGDVLVAPPGTPHCGWNLGPAGVHLRVRFRPALRWESLIQRLFTLAQQGCTDERGMPEPRFLLPLLNEFSREIAPAPTSE